MWIELIITIVICAMLITLVTLGIKFLNDYLLKRRYKYDSTNSKFKSREDVKRARAADTTTNSRTEQPRILPLPETLDRTTEVRRDEDTQPELPKALPRTIKSLKKVKKS